MKIDPTDKDNQFIIKETEVKHTYIFNPEYKPSAPKKKTWFHWSLIPITILVILIFR